MKLRLRLTRSSEPSKAHAGKTRKVGTSSKRQRSLLAERRASHHCHAWCCSTPCKPEWLMCPKHWRMVPEELKRRVWRHYRDGQCDDMRPSSAWFAATKAAIRAVAKAEGTTARFVVLAYDTEHPFPANPKLTLKVKRIV